LSKAKKKSLPRSEAEVAAIRGEIDDVGRINAQLLRARRQDADITQAQMGHALGLTEDIVSKFEGLKRPLSMEESIVWARQTGLDLKDYFEELQFQLRKIYPRKP
jgi:hypothetical protein